MAMAGGCVCGAVRFEWNSEVAPMFNGFCHCTTCRVMCSSSLPHLFGVPADSFKITKGEDKMKSGKNASGKLERVFCTECGVGIYQCPIGAPFRALFPSTFDWAREKKTPEMPAVFKPTVHMNCENSFCFDTVKNDGTVYLKDFPKEMGGSGLPWPQ
eukprot:Hpha_TRINITY_DN15262_c1_g15::TRINITY_DN15262_c1_g15_i1::g.64314::m.64314